MLERTAPFNEAQWRRATVAIVLSVLACPLSACEDTELDVLRTPSVRASNGPNTCLMDVLFLARNDSFWTLSSFVQSLDFSGNSRSSSPLGWNPQFEPRAKSKLDVRRSTGRAQLFWNDQVVDEFSFDKEFLLSDRVEVLSYVDSDGTRVEVHLFARPECRDIPDDFATPAQIEELER